MENERYSVFFRDFWKFYDINIENSKVQEDELFYLLWFEMNRYHYLPNDFPPINKIALVMVLDKPHIDITFTSRYPFTEDMSLKYRVLREINWEEKNIKSIDISSDLMIKSEAIMQNGDMTKYLTSMRYPVCEDELNAMRYNPEVQLYARNLDLGYLLIEKFHPEDISKQAFRLMTEWHNKKHIIYIFFVVTALFNLVRQYKILEDETLRRLFVIHLPKDILNTLKRLEIYPNIITKLKDIYELNTNDTLSLVLEIASFARYYEIEDCLNEIEFGVGSPAYIEAEADWHKHLV